MIQEPPEILPTDDMANPPDNLDPILCAHLLRKVDEQLIDLLNSLAPGERELQTVAPSWKVRDVAAHLLDTALRKLSLVRDACYVEAIDIRSPQDVVTLVNRLNREGCDCLPASESPGSDRDDETGFKTVCRFS